MACPPCVCRVLWQSCQGCEPALVPADLDHSNEELRAALKEWLWWLRDSIGFQVRSPVLLVRRATGLMYLSAFRKLRL